MSDTLLKVRDLKIGATVYPAGRKAPRHRNRARGQL